MIGAVTDSYMDNTTFQPTTESTIYSTPNLTTIHSTPNMTTMSSAPWTNLTTGFIPVTTETTDTTYPEYVGFITAVFAVLVYGTNFAPVKKFETGDGMFFQWILCIAIWTTGLAVQIIRHSPTFHPICMLGGFLWETGNICVVPIVKTIGLGLGLSIWAMINLMSGWATGRFGLFGTNKETLSSYVLNDVGVALAVCSAVIFSQVRNNVDGSQDGDIEIAVNEQTPLIKDTPSSINNEEQSAQRSDGEDDKTFIDNLSPSSKRIVGVLLSVASGLMYGQLFTPAKYLQDHGHSNNGLDYVFSTYCGIIATSTLYFLIYSALMKNKPKVYPRVILPGFISGMMWGVATSSWFVANKVLSISVAFPIVTTGPAIVASLLGVFVFREITGRRNLIVLVIGMTFALAGSIISGFSL